MVLFVLLLFFGSLLSTSCLGTKYSACWQVILQSDVPDVALDMRDQFDARADVLKHIDALDANFTCDAQGWLLENPMGEERILFAKNFTLNKFLASSKFFL